MAKTTRDRIYSAATKVRHGMTIAQNPLYYLYRRAEHFVNYLLDRPITPDRSRPNVAQAPKSPRQFHSLPTLASPSSEPLQGEKPFQGRRGRYQRTALLNPDKKWYEGRHVSSHQPIWVREYSLPEDSLSADEMTERRELFEQLNHFKFQSAGNNSDFRLVIPLEAIAPPQENRYYWVTKAIPNSITLREYVAHYGAMSPEDVRQVLLQVLQTLMFLHNQRWIGSWQRGIFHGNLSLDSLLITAREPSSQDEDPPLHPKFWIYITDLALWEHLFYPPNQAIGVPSAAQDLKDLGQIGENLLFGGDIKSSQKLSVEAQQHWQTIPDPPLTQFIERLKRLSGSSFDSAEAAYNALLKLPVQQDSDAPEVEADTDEPLKASLCPLFLKLALLTSILAIFGLIIGVSWRRLTNPRQIAELPSTVCCIDAIEAPAVQTVEYMAESGGSWQRALTQPGLVAANQTLLEALQSRDQRLKRYELQQELIASSDEAIAKLQNGEADFILTRKQEDLPEGLIQEEVAYDAVVFITAFSDGVASGMVERSPSLPQLLNGKINLDQLQALYTGEIEDWGAPRSLRDWSVKLYMPTEPDAVEIFEQIVLKDDFRRVGRFKRLQGVEILRPDPTIQSFRQIFADFEEGDDVLSVGFALFSHVYKQCSVYPLATGERGQEVQILFQGESPIHPDTDLCNDKGSYFPNINAVRSYPLSYPLVVVYPKEGGRSQIGQWFAKILRTDEGQQLLSETGLIPILSLKP